LRADEVVSRWARANKHKSTRGVLNSQVQRRGTGYGVAWTLQLVFKG
jgi:hypothetical protein